MYSLSLLRIILALSSIFTCIYAERSFPLGIHLGPKYITAATTHANGTISPIAAIKGSTAYQFILSPPNPSTSPPNAALVPKILRTVFNGMKSSADIELGEKVRNVVITVPNHIETEIREAVIRAAGLAGFNVLAELRFTDAVGVAYNFISSGDKGEEEEEEEGDGGEKDGDGGDGDGGREGEKERGKGWTVVVEYNESGLEVWVMDGAWGVTPKGHIMFPELGVEAIIDEAVETYFLTVSRRLEACLRKFLVRGDGEVVKVKGVVLVGDASEKAMVGMKGVLEEVLGGLGYKDVKRMVRDEVEGLYVGSVGAARRGWEFVRERERERGHEEL